MFNSANTPPQMIVSQVVSALLKYRQGIEVGPNLYAWSSAISLDDLMRPQPDGPGFNLEDSQDILSACADCWGHSQLYYVGTDPRNPQAGYVYGASQQRVIGPRVM